MTRLISNLKRCKKLEIIHLLLILSILICIVFYYSVMSTKGLLAQSQFLKRRLIVKEFKINSIQSNYLASSQVNYSFIKSIYMLPDLLSKRKGYTMYGINSQIIKLFSLIFEIEYITAHTIIPKCFTKKAVSLFKNIPNKQATYQGSNEKLILDKLSTQNVIIITNKFTFEQSIFNIIRKYRPGASQRLNIANKHKILAKNIKKCDFCTNRKHVAADNFLNINVNKLEYLLKRYANVKIIPGHDTITITINNDHYKISLNQGRIFGKHCYTASNIAKYCKHHGLIIPYEHSPFNALRRGLLQDYIYTSLIWLNSMHTNMKPYEYIYPHIFLDMGPKASASQEHTHFQLILTKQRYLGKIEKERQAVHQYSITNTNRNYWEDLISLHLYLGLGVIYRNQTKIDKTLYKNVTNDDAIIISHVAPIKDKEIIIISNNPFSTSFSFAMEKAIDALFESGTTALSMMMVLDPLNNKLSKHSTQPGAIVKIIDRGNILDNRSDTGSMEYYGSNNIINDPYELIKYFN